MSNTVKFFIAVPAILGILFIASGIYRGSERDVTAYVVDKERVCNSDECTYLIFTDHGTYKLQDTLLYRRFNTSDAYGQITVDETHRFHLVGWRFGPLSMYPNILTAEKAG